MDAIARALQGGMIMREILFRGKAINRDKGYYRTDYKEYDWVYGLITRLYDERFEILPATMVNTYGISGIDVDYKTIGQFTGVTDKNGKKIFEGDIVKTHYANTKKNDFVEQVVFHNGKFCSMFELSGGGKMFANLADGIPHLPQDRSPYMEWCEVIGNIYDTPKLLKGEEK